jgi:putative ABC transport system permease protein
MSWLTRIANVFRSSETAADLDEELQFHLDQRVADLIKDGTPQNEARQIARRQLGNRLSTREASHEIKSAAWLESLSRDFRFGARMLLRYRVASLAAILSLALAIGSCTAAFSLIDALLFRPLPVPAPHELFDLARVFPPFMSPDKQSREFQFFSAPQFEMLRDAARDSADLFFLQYSAGFAPAMFDDSGGASENIRSEPIDGHGFGILGVKPLIGRLIQPDDDSSTAGHMVAVLSYPFWKRRFAGSPSVIGHTVNLGPKTYQIIGVAAPPFSGVHTGFLTDLWFPFFTGADPRVLAQDVELCPIWGRVHPGVDRVQLQARLQAVFTNALAETIRTHPPRNMRGDELQQYAAQPLRIRDASTGNGSFFREQFRRPFQILTLICALLLLVACSNVANLMLARASARDAEMALRISLGAARSRLIQQMLVESLQVALIATILAALFAALVAPAIVARLGPSEFPAFLEVAPDARSLAFAAALALASTLLFGLIPALRASSAAPEAALKRGTANQSSRLGALRCTLAAQVGFSVAVLFLSGLLLLSFRKLTTVDVGFNRRNVVLFDLRPAVPDPFTFHAIARTKLLEHIRGLPGVRSASYTAQRPMGGDMVWMMMPFVRFSGRQNETIRPVQIPISDGFFEAMQIRWIAGRDFLPEEIARESDSTIVNQAFVDTYLRAANPIGQVFETIGDVAKPVRHQIVGVAASIHYNRPRHDDGPTFYTPLRDDGEVIPGTTRRRNFDPTMNVRADSMSPAFITWLRQQIETAEPALRARNTTLLESQIDNTLLSERLLALLV